MPVENLTFEERLNAELRDIRREARVTQQELARLAHVSVSTIKAIERSDPLPKTETLQAIARAAATDGAGSRDDVKAARYYGRLLAAAGRAPAAQTAELSQPSSDLLRGKLAEAFGRDAPVIEEFLIDAADYHPDDRLFMLQTLNWMRSLVPAGRQVRARNAASLART